MNKVNCGVPQGSILGPLLFILYVNDLPDCLQNSNCILFADDTTIYCQSQNINTLYNNMNHELETLNDWFMANKLSLNINKPKHILLTKLKI